MHRQQEEFLIVYLVMVCQNTLEKDSYGKLSAGRVQSVAVRLVVERERN